MTQYEADPSRAQRPLPVGPDHPARALTIAGSDSGGGAGIQADLKTFAALGAYGMSAITAITAQNTIGVQAAYELPTSLIAAQIESVISDIGVDVAKTGMLSSPAIIEVVAEHVRRWRLRLVVDPVMVAKSGDALLQPQAVATLRSVLLPLAEVVTPNLPEAAVLIGQPITSIAEMRAAARAIHALGPRAVVIKGGHLEEDGAGSGPSASSQALDILFDGETMHELVAPRYATPHTHGTGCTFSAAITALLARGLPLVDAVEGAKRYITGAIQHAPGLGHGHGPVDHFWQMEAR